jgi:hypothetical protein
VTTYGSLTQSFTKEIEAFGNRRWIGRHRQAPSPLALRVAMVASAAGLAASVTSFPLLHPHPADSRWVAPSWPPPSLPQPGTVVAPGIPDQPAAPSPAAYKISAPITQSPTRRPATLANIGPRPRLVSPEPSAVVSPTPMEPAPMPAQRPATVAVTTPQPEPEQTETEQVVPGKAAKHRPVLHIEGVPWPATMLPSVKKTSEA